MVSCAHPDDAPPARIPRMWPARSRPASRGYARSNRIGHVPGEKNGYARGRTDRRIAAIIAHKPRSLHRTMVPGVDGAPRRSPLCCHCERDGDRRRPHVGTAGSNTMPGQFTVADFAPLRQWLNVDIGVSGSLSGKRGPSWAGQRAAIILVSMGLRVAS